MPIKKEEWKLRKLQRRKASVYLNKEQKKTQLPTV